MTYVVGENCIRCKLTDCVEVCPVDCFYEGPNTLVINPDECIDCDLCVPEHLRARRPGLRLAQLIGSRFGLRHLFYPYTG